MTCVDLGVTDAVKERDGCDYFKAVFGVRPRFDVSGAEAYDRAAAEVRRRCATVEGRNAMRNDGWLLVGDPDCYFRE